MSGDDLIRENNELRAQLEEVKEQLNTLREVYLRMRLQRGEIEI